MDSASSTAAALLRRNAPSTVVAAHFLGAREVLVDARTVRYNNNLVAAEAFLLGSEIYEGHCGQGAGDGQFYLVAGLVRLPLPAGAVSVAAAPDRKRLRRALATTNPQTPMASSVVWNSSR